jgi:hypothetical protein
MTPGLELGTPGVYRVAEHAVAAGIGAVRLDIAGFAGIAPRGPVDEPVALDSWSDYRRRFGGFEGPGLLPYAVAAFFDQGGARAWVVRVAPPRAAERPPDANIPISDFAISDIAISDIAGSDFAGSLPEADPAAVAASALHRLDPHVVTTGAGPVEFTARDEGSWGDRLRLRLGFETAETFAAGPDDLATAGLPGRGGAAELRLPAEVPVPAGSLLRLRGAGLPGVGVLRWVDAVEDRETAPGRRDRIAVLDEALPGAAPARVPFARAVAPAGSGSGGAGPAGGGSGGAGLAGGGGALTVAVVTGTLVVDDDDPTFARGEMWAGLGLRPDHPRWLGRVVAEESMLVAPAGPWQDSALVPAGPLLDAAASTRERGGTDRYALINRSSFFDPGDGDADPEDDRRPTGVDALVRVPEIGLLAVPDLLYRWADPEDEPGGPGGPGDRGDDPPPARPAGFVRCEPFPPTPQAVPRRVPPHGDLLDARDDLAEIVDRQRALVARTRPSRSFVVLLDSPPGLPASGLQQWRAAFDSSYAAAYHPWLRIARDDDERGGLVTVPPSAFAAGIIAARERRLGLPWGPSNELARGAVAASEVTTAAEQAVLHRQGINVFVPERDGFRLSAARTLSRDRDYRQLSVRRLMTMLRMSIERDLEWVVFEPHTVTLRTALCVRLATFLSGLHRAGAFAGESEDEAFFVRCDDALNPRASTDAGRLIIEVGVAPVEPVEFIVLRVALEADRGITVEAAS